MGFAAMARAAERRMADFNTRDLASIAYASAAAGRTSAPLFTSLMRAAERRLDGFNPQDFVTTAWAFATAGELAPDVFSPTSMLDAVEAHGIKAQVVNYAVSMHGLVASGHVAAGYALLVR